MKAVVCTAYGPPEVLQLKDLAKPTPRAGQVLIRVHATSVNTGDWRLRKADPWAIRLFLGLTRPRLPVLGGNLAGTIEAVGAGVSRFRVGDKVYGSTGMKLGAYAEYCCLPENAVLTSMPSNMTFEEAASVPFGGMTALAFLQRAQVKTGDKVLIYGASGSVGTAAVQLARSFGAAVTGVCSSRNADFVRDLGAHHVLDYARSDWMEGKVYDCVMECVGKLSFAHGKSLVKKGGRLILISAGPRDMLLGQWTSMLGDIQVFSGVSKEEVKLLDFLRNEIEAGRYKAAIDRRYPLEEMVAAHRYAEEGPKRGNIVVIPGAVA